MVKIIIAFIYIAKHTCNTNPSSRIARYYSRSMLKCMFMCCQQSFSSKFVNGLFLETTHDKTREIRILLHALYWGKLSEFCLNHREDELLVGESNSLSYNGLSPFLHFKGDFSTNAAQTPFYFFSTFMP